MNICVDRIIVRSEVRKVGKDQIIKGFVVLSSEFRFYFRCSERKLKDEQGINI